MKLRLVLASAVLILASCSGSNEGPAPPVSAGVSAFSHSVGHLIMLGGIKPDAKCPRGYVYCVTVSAGQPVQLYFCYSPGSYCGPSQYQYAWQSLFEIRKSGSIISYFSGAFSPNPGDPTYDTISEIEHLNSTHGKYKYAQKICPVVGSLCSVHFYVGIAIK